MITHISIYTILDCKKVTENANGCGPAASNIGRLALFKDTLKCACDRHDICYACVSCGLKKFNFKFNHYDGRQNGSVRCPYIKKYSLCK